MSNQSLRREKLGPLGLIQALNDKKMAEASSAILQVFDDVEDNTARCEPSTYRKLFINGETYVYELPGEFQYIKIHPAEPSAISDMILVLTDDRHPDKQCRYVPYGTEIPDIPAMMAENLAIRETTQAELSQAELNKGPKTAKYLGIWKTKRDPAMWYNRTDWESLILSSKGSRFEFKTSAGRVIKHLEGRAILDFPDHREKTQVLDAPAYIEIEPNIRHRLIVDSATHLMHVGRGLKKEPQSSKGTSRPGTLSPNKRPPPSSSPADTKERETKKIKASAASDSSQQKAPQSGLPGTPSNPRTSSASATPESGQVKPSAVKPLNLPKGRPVAIKTGIKKQTGDGPDGMKLPPSQRKSASTTPTITIPNNPSTVTPLSSTMQSGERSSTNVKSSVARLHASDTESFNGDESDTEHEKINWDARRQGIRTGPEISTPLATASLQTPRNITDTNKFKELRERASAYVQTEARYQELKQRFEKQEAQFEEARKEWTEERARHRAESEELGAVIDELRAKRKRVEEGFREKLKEAREERNAAESFAVDVENSLKTLTLEKAAVDAELAQFRREVEMVE